jgi:transcriptional regulator with XRE-family HTH domain
MGEILTLGKKIRQLRLQRGWSQQELANKVGIGQKQVSAYERDANTPSGEIFIALAKALEVSLDYLAQLVHEDTAQLAVADRELLEKVQRVDKLSEEDRALVKGVMDLVILKHRFRALAQEAVPVRSGTGG